MRERIGGGVGVAVIVAALVAITSLDVGGRGVVLGVLLGFMPGVAVAVCAMFALSRVRSVVADVPPAFDDYANPPPAPPVPLPPPPPQRRITIPRTNVPVVTASPTADVVEVHLSNGRSVEVNADAAYLFVSMEQPARERNGVRVWRGDNTQFTLVASVLEDKGFVVRDSNSWRWATPNAQRQARAWLDRWCAPSRTAPPTAAVGVPVSAENAAFSQTDTQQMPA